MVKTLSAVYENGMLRLLEPLALAEHQQVTVTVTDSSADPADPWIDHEYVASLETRLEGTEPTPEELRAAFSNVVGNLSDDIRAQRDSRG